jgi:hypothetical protein
MSRLERFLPLAALLGLIFGGILAVHTWQQWKLFSLGDPTPRTVRLADLERGGPGDNIHVRVTGFVLAPNYVVEKKRGGTWNRVWVPMLPADQPGRRDVKVVARVFDVADEGQLQMFYHQTELTGLIVNAVWGVGSQEAERLKANYPGTDFSAVLLLDVNRGFPTRENVALLIGAAGGLLAVGTLAAVGWVIVRLRARGR